ncbi:MAG: amino acid adenylation domain-containing protein [Myxococcota bacterium]
MNLAALVRQAAARTPEALAVHAPDASLSYGQLDRASDSAARGLIHLGVSPGDRVGIWLDKSSYVVPAMQAALRAGAAYVPLDPLMPIARVRTVLRDCGILALVTTTARAVELDAADRRAERAYVLVDEPDTTTTPSGRFMTWRDLDTLPDGPLDRPLAGSDDLAYILYTSGSTGTPKGVCLSHRNALSFVQWAHEAIGARPDDRLSNHAPFHFDLSVLDLYVAFCCGASVHLLPDGMAYRAPNMVDFITSQSISVWYSVPSALILMMEHGGMLDTRATSLRTILFAGEPFALPMLRRLQRHWPAVTLMNLYGPTETNVCTYHRVVEADVADSQSRPVPIGRACSGDRVWAVRQDGQIAGPGEEGELWVEGPTVMMGYWGHPPQGSEPYRTGDIVRLREDGNYEYRGRRDHMVKVRGHRVELGEIEAILGQHQDVTEAAVVVVGSGMHARLIAFLTGEHRPALLDVKRHCAEHLPRYMIVDRIRHVRELPRTRNGKIDRKALVAMASAANAAVTTARPSERSAL